MTPSVGFLSFFLQKKKQLLNGCTCQNVSTKSCHISKKNENGHSIFGFFGSDPYKMNQTRKLGEQTSQILEFKPEGLEGYD